MKDSAGNLGQLPQKEGTVGLPRRGTPWASGSRFEQREDWRRITLLCTVEDEGECTHLPSGATGSLALRKN